MKGKIHVTIKRNVPWKEINARGRPSWMTKEVMAAIKKKKALEEGKKKDNISEVKGG
jgi:hypothetical protein